MYKTTAKVLELAPMGRRCNAWRVRGDEVVFTYGNFEALDLPTLHLMETAREQAHRLVVGVVDAPAEMAELMAGLFVVDGVVALSAAELSDALQTLRPEVVVSHPDWPTQLPSEDLETVGSRHVVL